MKLTKTTMDASIAAEAGEARNKYADQFSCDIKTSSKNIQAIPQTNRQRLGHVDSTRHLGF
ncbi:MAG: hypothetical protein MK171_03560 [Pirellulales bacterium]|nr:hypothetical protein [Pirellulales bacterium]